MDIKMNGFVIFSDIRKMSIVIFSTTANKKMPVDLFTGIKKFRNFKDWMKIQILDFLIKNKSPIYIEGYAYNSNLLIADHIEIKDGFLFNELIDSFKSQSANRKLK